MAVKIIDRLETIEIENTDRQTLRPDFGARKFFIQLREELAAVGQVRQRVEIGEPKVLVTQRKGAYLRNDQTCEIAVVDHQHRQHRDRGKREVDGHRNEYGAARATEVRN